MIDCTPLVIDDATLAHLLSLASNPPWTHAPLALRVTPAQIAALDVEFVDGVAYLGDVPVTTGETQPPPRPRAPVVVEPVVVDLAEAKAARIVELQASIRAHVDEVLPRDEREIALADYCDLLFALIGGAFVDGEAATILQAKKNFTLRARVEGLRVEAACNACVTVDDLADVVVDFATIGGL